MADLSKNLLAHYADPKTAWLAKSGFGGGLGAWYTDPATGKTYQPLTSGGNDNAEGGGGVAPQVTGYAGYDLSLPGGQRAEDGQTYDELDAQGNFVANRDFLSTKDDWQLALYALAAAGGMQFLPGGAFGGAGGAAGGAAGATEAAGGLTGAAAGDAGLMYAGADAAAAGSLGTGTLTGAQVLSGAALPTVAGTTAAATIPAAASGSGSILSKIGSALGLTGAATTGAGGGFDWTSLVGPAISAAGGVYGANQAGKAADAQLQAAREAMALNEPFRQGGIKGMNRLLDLLGVSGNTGAEGYGSAAKSFGAADFQADPGYQFRQSEGQKALERRLSAGGSLYSGKALKDSMRFNQGEASQEYGNAFNRFQVERQAKLNPLQSLMGAGQTAANTVADYRTQAGNAQASGIVGKANALTGAIGQGVSMYQNQQQNAQNNYFQNALLERFMRG